MPYAYRDRDLVARARSYDLTEHDSVEIINAGDIHGGDCYCNMDAVRAIVAWLEANPSRYAILTGDIFNMATQGSVSLQLSEPNTPTVDTRHLLTKMLQPVAGQILAAIGGNHDDRLCRMSGEDSVDALMCALGIGDRYFPEGEVFMRLRVGFYSHNDSPVLYNLYATHGNAGGRLPGGKANALVALRNIVHNCDIYMNGHGHTPLVIPEVAWSFDSKGDIRRQDQFFISCGATLRRGGYPVRKGFPPLSTVFPTVTLHGDGHKHITAHAAS